MLEFRVARSCSERIRSFLRELKRVGEFVQMAPNYFRFGSRWWVSEFCEIKHTRQLLEVATYWQT